MYRKIKAIMKPTSNLGTTFLEVTNRDGTTLTITNEQQMEQAVIDENISKYY